MNSEPYKDKAGISDLVRDETSNDDAKRSKPHPDIFQAALAGLDGIATETVLVVTTRHGMPSPQGGPGCGPSRCGVEDFPRAIFDDPEDLLTNFAEAFS